MADIEHSALTDPEIHEPKGITSAPVNTAYIADGASGGAWSAVTMAGDVTTAVVVASSSDPSDQGPTATDTEHQVTFGAGGTVSGDATINGDGSISIVNTCSYIFLLNLNYGRDASSGLAQMNVRVLVNGSQIGGSGNTWLANSDSRITKSTPFMLNLIAADVVTIEIVRDGNGTNDGGLFEDTPSTPGWNPVPSANLTIFKYLV